MHTADVILNSVLFDLFVEMQDDMTGRWVTIKTFEQTFQVVEKKFLWCIKYRSKRCENQVESDHRLAESIRYARSLSKKTRSNVRIREYQYFGVCDDREYNRVVWKDGEWLI